MNTGRKATRVSTRLNAQNTSTANARRSTRPGASPGTILKTCCHSTALKPINRYRLAINVTHSARRGFNLNMALRFLKVRDDVIATSIKNKADCRQGAINFS
ncbi:hypothetical protein D3C77_589490 [compost metagenome]